MKNKMMQFVAQSGRSLLPLLAAVILLAAAGLAGAEEPVQRTELMRADLSGSETMEVVVTRLVLLPGAVVPLHTHPGDEHLYILEGGPMRTADGRTVPFETGTAMHFPAGQVHGGLTAIGDAPVVALTTHIVEKGQPISQLAE